MLPFSGVLFCSDLDGTLTASNDTISQENVSAIRRFCALGGRFTIATGRFPDFIRPFVFAHPGILTAPLVSMNGALIYDLDKNMPLSVKPLTSELIPVLSLSMTLPGLSVIHMHQMSGSWAWKGDKDSEMHLEKEPVLKIVTVWENARKAEEAQKVLIREYGNSFDILRSWPMGVELLDPQGGKGIGMDFLRENLPDVRLIASAGDYENDLPMFAHSDYSFAPVNAIEAVRQAATHPLQENHEGNFIASALYRLEKIIEG